jgi:hypothetical protein
MRSLATLTPPLFLRIHATHFLWSALYRCSGNLLVLVLVLFPSLSSAEPLVAAVLPSSRSVQAGKTATAFATIINAAQEGTATGCSLAPRTAAVPATFTYQTTNPLTNAVTGTPNTPVDIPAGGRQTFVFAFTPTAAFVSTDVQFSFACTNATPAMVITGVNTLLLSASPAPVPDMIALAATLTQDGIANVDPQARVGVFAVATANVGSSGAITVSATTGGVTIPLSLVLCETNPTTGACMAPPSASVTTQINANATPTFGIFITGNDTIPFDPATNRIFVRFASADGVVRGSTSVAVRTGTATPSPATLIVTKAGSGSGTVTSTPAGITCGATCTANFPSGTFVILTATPAVGSIFTGWSGACGGTASCNEFLFTATAVTAAFVLVVDFSTLPDRITTNLSTFFVSGKAQPGSQVIVNGTNVVHR